MGDNWIEGIVYENVERGGMRKKRDEELLASYRDITFGITVIARVSSVRNLTASYQVKAPFKFFLYYVTDVVLTIQHKKLISGPKVTLSTYPV